MSDEYNKYISDMKSAYKEDEINIWAHFEKRDFKHKLDLLLNNNAKIKDYIALFTIGSGIKDETENLKAVQELNQIHYKFMRDFYRLIGLDVFI